MHTKNSDLIDIIMSATKLLVAIDDEMSNPQLTSYTATEDLRKQRDCVMSIIPTFLERNRN